MRTNGEIERDAQIVTFLRRCAVALEEIAGALKAVEAPDVMEDPDVKDVPSEAAEVPNA